jgi:flagellar motor switch protein FliN/FliY
MSARSDQTNDLPSVAEFASELASTADEYSSTLQPTVPDEIEPEAVGAVDVASPFAPVMRIPLNLKVVLGSATMPMSELARLQKGALISLDRRVGDTADIIVNGHCFAKGEVVLVDEKTSRFGILLTEIGVLPPDKDRKREPGA